MEATKTGEWQIRQILEEDGHVYSVSVPDVAGTYLLTYSSGDVLRAILQFDTNVGAGATIISATLTRTKPSGLPETLNYYLGTWAATPPAADEPTFNGGTIAGTETSAAIEASVALDPSLINKVGITSLRIEFEDEGFASTAIENVGLTLVYTMPVRGKWPFMAAE